MHPSLIPPRQVTIGDAAAFAGTTPRAIRHYHGIGLLPEPTRGSDGRRRYGYEELVRLLWIRKIADAGVALSDIRDAFAESAPGGTADDDGGVMERLEETLAAQEAELARQRALVGRMRRRGSRMGLLSDIVASRLEDLPDGSLRDADLDSLLMIERSLGPLVAALNSTRYIAMAARPDLREESDRVEAAEEALDHTVSVDDPRVARAAAQRHRFDRALSAAIRDSGLDQQDEALWDDWDAIQEAVDGEVGAGTASAGLGIEKLPYDFSPARLRCIEIGDQLAIAEFAAEEAASEAAGS